MGQVFLLPLFAILAVGSVFGVRAEDNYTYYTWTVIYGNDSLLGTSQQELCPFVKNILLLDSEGKSIAVKYNSDDWPTNNAKDSSEKVVFTKTHKTNARTEGVMSIRRRRSEI